MVGGIHVRVGTRAEKLSISSSCQAFGLEKRLPGVSKSGFLFLRSGACHFRRGGCCPRAFFVGRGGVSVSCFRVFKGVNIPCVPVRFPLRPWGMGGNLRRKVKHFSPKMKAYAVGNAASPLRSGQKVAALSGKRCGTFGEKRQDFLEKAAALLPWRALFLLTLPAC